MHRSLRHLGLGILTLTAAFAAACQPAVHATPTPTSLPPTVPAPTATTIPQPEHATNPLSGLDIADPSLLEIPVVLLSISHFPATARPQAGLSFAPFVYEFYITEGATRFLAAFYGEWPSPEIAVQGGCEARIGPLARTATLLGNRVWFDTNQNGAQDLGEGGIAGLCVNLYDEFDNLLAKTTTDTNGYYGFNAPPGHYTVEFVRPNDLAFANRDEAEDARDSDADPSTGRAPVNLQADDLSIDAGMTASESTAATSDAGAALPPSQVGPIRSGRLIYRHLAQSFQDSCLIFAYASPEILERLPHCAFVPHEISGGGSMIDLAELWSIAAANARLATSELDYSGYQFSDSPPPEGVPAMALGVYFSNQNQSGWYYDPLSESYLRYVDTSVRQHAGILHPDTDRLTGRQLHLENLIVLFAKHQVVSPTNLDIRLDPGRTGNAILFRDGLALRIDWAAPQAGQGEGGHPIRFFLKNGEPALLKPGHTWVIVVTDETTVAEKAEGIWQLTFVAPPRAK